jgi:Fe-S-cluster-containing dehydrogenase component
MKQNRRDFLKTLGIVTAATTGLKTKKANAEPKNILSDERMGVLVDTTVCIGCRKCEWACKIEHNLPTPPIEKYENRSVFKDMRRPDTGALTVVNEYQNPMNPEIPINVKVNCMHCDHPACVSACIVGAFSKQENGTVVWDTDKCIGCRYCMVACPFQIPAFEFDTALHPDILKCDFCYERSKNGQIPACVEICPVEAMTYGKRYEILELAHKRIKRKPDRYIDHVYGEHEAGGTSWVYLAGKDFNKLDFPKVGNKPMPGTSESIQHAIFAYFVPPAALYGLLAGIMWLSKNNNTEET